MKTTFTWIGGALVVFLLFGVGWYYYNFTQYAPTTYVTDTPTGSTTTDTKTGTTSTTTPTYTMADVSTHNSISSCYSVVSGSVYDLTMWINLHPGGKGAILSMCGTDGTSAFMNQHRGKSKFMTILARYKIGTLIQ